MNQNLFLGIECSVLEVITWEREQEENQKEWRAEEERRLTERQNFALEAERQLRDPRYIRRHTNRLLWRASKGLRYFRITLSRDGLAHTPNRKDKCRMKKNLRKRARQLEFLTQRGETSAPGQGITKTGALTTVVAAT